MVSDPLVPTANASGRRGGWRFFLLRTRLGQLLLVLVAMRILGALGIFPSVLTTTSTVALWVYAIVLVGLGVARLRTKLLWKIRRKLVISYLLIGLVPTILILFFFLLSAYFVFGQVSSYMLNTSLRRIESDARAAADLAVSDHQGLHRSTGHLSDKELRAVLDARLAKIRSAFQQTGAIYLEHRRGRIQRVVNTDRVPSPPAVGTNLPKWTTNGHRGPIRMGGTSYLGAVSAPVQTGVDQGGHTVIILSDLRDVLESAASENGFHIDQVLAGVSEGGNASITLPAADVAADSGDLSTSDAANAFTLPWLALLQTESWEQSHSDEPDFVFVQFGFAPLSLYNSIASNALQLGPEGPDLGQIILGVLVALAGLFLVIEVLAILMGLVLARSITGSVHALSQGTDHVRQGDFSYKVQMRSRDQLGELADSFNLMTTSIQDLLRQSAEKERLEEELRIARSIQMSLLPKDRVSVPGLSIAALCLPATEVGGDYYDFIPLDDDRLALLIADVSGKGTSAALYMAELKGLMLSLSRIYDSPRALLIEANKILAENLDSRSFITMVYAVIDMKKRTMTYARAGHNPIFQLPGNGNGPVPHPVKVLTPNGLGLALDPGAQFERILREDSVTLLSGDLFLFFTDGLSEAMNVRSDLFGEDRLRQVIETNANLSVEELREKVIDEVFAFAGGAVQHDDMTMVLVKVL